MARSIRSLIQDHSCNTPRCLLVLNRLTIIWRTGLQFIRTFLYNSRVPLDRSLIDFPGRFSLIHSYLFLPFCCRLVNNAHYVIVSIILALGVHRLSEESAAHKITIRDFGCLAQLPEKYMRCRKIMLYGEILLAEGFWSTELASIGGQKPCTVSSPVCLSVSHMTSNPSFSWCWSHYHILEMLCLVCSFKVRSFLFMISLSSA